jgi:hypothetical protein
MNLQEYKDLRKKLREIHNNILELVSQDDATKAAKLLGTLENKEIVLESPTEQDAHMDFFVYGEIFNGSSKLAIYKKKHNEENNEDHKLMKVMEKSDTSLYEVVEIDRENKTVLFKDVLHPSNEVFKVVDTGMSETLNENILVFTRLLHLENFSMTSGLIFIFRREHQEYLLRRSRKIAKKLENGNDSDKRFIAFFELNRRDGMPALLEDVE